jgi:hypothetical protein
MTPISLSSGQASKSMNPRFRDLCMEFALVVD